MNKKKNTCKCIAFILITVMLVLGLSEGMKSTSAYSAINIKGMYLEDKNTLDAVVIGASEVYTGYAPTYAWEEHGYTSYALSSPGLAGGMYKPMLGDMMMTQKPTTIVVEVGGFLHGDDYMYREGVAHNVIDNMRWSKHRVEAIKTVVPEENQKTFFFPLSAYHNNWNSPKRMLRCTVIKTFARFRGQTYMKGYSTYSVNRGKKKQKKEGTIDFTPKCEAALLDLLEFLKEENVEHVLFYRAPHQVVYKNDEEIERVWELVRSYGFDVLDCGKDFSEINIDTNTDFYNKEHLNYYGAVKFTDYLSTYMVEHYDMPSRDSHSAKIVKKWDVSAEKTDEVFEKIQKDIEEGNDRHYTEAAIYVSPKLMQKLEKVTNEKDK